MLPLTVALPLGIGDCHWACQKLRALSAYHDGRPIHAYVNTSPNHASLGFLSLVPYIEKAQYSEAAPHSITMQMPPGHRDPKWSTLEGCRGWEKFDYILVANGHLERGERIETWLPELETDYTYPLNIADDDVTIARLATPANSVLLYPSGIGPNTGFHNNTWTVHDWAQVILNLNEAGVIPTLIGANTPDDTGYRDWVMNRVVRWGGQARDMVGKTTQPQVLAMIREASAVAGLNSGLMICSAMQNTPTVMFWANQRFGANVGVTHSLLPEGMATSWLGPDQLGTYRVESFGDPKMTSESVVAKILEVRR